MPRQRSNAAKPAVDGLSSTRDEAEIARFDAMAATWWDEAGPMAVLHRFNPVRVAWIRDRAIEHFGRAPRSLTPLDGLDLVDIGCGGGILSEPMARLGATVTGLDPAPGNVSIARAHAEQMGLSEAEGGPAYREATIEQLVAEGRRFDIVLAMEVIEHVADPRAFVKACAAAVKPGGLLVMATLNRTLRSFALAIVGAEYVLRWLPRGTHHWDRFITPDELSGMIASTGLSVTGDAGVVFNPLSGDWSLSSDTAVNYMLSATRGEV
ncbi:MAG: bifunctional 2-polyprenyl-6-hydroxyphenol methylase/3-demethylubiquinol 3-O-methyltransferase UbiG [Bosea sp. (in: a-proteobacteria)]